MTVLGSIRSVSGVQVVVRGDQDDHSRVQLDVHQPFSEMTIRTGLDAADVMNLARVVDVIFGWMLDEAAAIETAPALASDPELAAQAETGEGTAAVIDLFGRIEAMRARHAERLAESERRVQP